MENEARLDLIELAAGIAEDGDTKTILALIEALCLERDSPVVVSLEPERVAAVRAVAAERYDALVDLHGLTWG